MERGGTGGEGKKGEGTLCVPCEREERMKSWNMGRNTNQVVPSSQPPSDEPNYAWALGTIVSLGSLDIIEDSSF